MSNKIYTLDEIKSIAAPIARQYGVAAMYLFGSLPAAKPRRRAISIFASNGDAFALSSN